MTNVLIGVDELRARLDEPRLRIADVRFDLADTAKGEAAYRSAHVPGAIYAHLDRDLSDHSLNGLGRHPLPDAETFARWLSLIGYAPDQAWVVYDEANGSFAARLWWMLRAVGHRDVRVLDGGCAAWVAAKAPFTDAVPNVVPTSVEVRYAESTTADFAEVDALRNDGSRRLVDARATPRFRGEVEPLDPVAGHVPGAINRPFADNLDASGRFKPAEALREEWLRMLGGVSPERVVHMCGSGVTACHNLLAMEHAGLSGSRLFPPSWSGWVGDRRRAVATGDV
ncbi:MAG TPA: sulfurtransferase [Pseudomonadota bacterium]|jgi:thiosulfate/3-mercaptopyruvate sulfurtransferase|nr:sulfurtransferase [Pseudomonadota bacterium]